MTAKSLEKGTNGRLMVHVYLTEEEKKRIEAEAAKLGISVSSYIKVKLFSRL
jgi:hypothetical protein